MSSNIETEQATIQEYTISFKCYRACLLFIFIIHCVSVGQIVNSIARKKFDKNKNPHFPINIGLSIYTAILSFCVYWLLWNSRETIPEKSGFSFFVVMFIVVYISIFLVEYFGYPWLTQKLKHKYNLLRWYYILPLFYLAQFLETDDEFRERHFGHTS